MTFLFLLVLFLLIILTYSTLTKPLPTQAFLRKIFGWAIWGIVKLLNLIFHLPKPPTEADIRQYTGESIFNALQACEKNFPVKVKIPFDATDCAQRLVFRYKGSHTACYIDLLSLEPMVKSIDEELLWAFVDVLLDYQTSNPEAVGILDVVPADTTCRKIRFKFGFLPNQSEIDSYLAYVRRKHCERIPVETVDEPPLDKDF